MRAQRIITALTGLAAGAGITGSLALYFAGSLVLAAMVVGFTAGGTSVGAVMAWTW
jgi:hypothetical protein